MSSWFPRLSVLAAGMGLLLVSSVRAENVVLRQSFDGFAVDEVGTVGSEQDEGGAWKEFGKIESSPKATDQEKYTAQSGGAGKSVRIIRDDTMIQTPDFWLMGSWNVPLETGKLRIGFRVLRDSPDSGFSVHLGTEEKTAGQNTIAVSVGSRGTSGEKLMVMTDDGKWLTTTRVVPVGSWAQVVFDIDLSGGTYSVSLDGEPVVTDPMPFKRDGSLRRISFLPAAPNGNVSFIDDVEVLEVD